MRQRGYDVQVKPRPTIETQSLGNQGGKGLAPNDHLSQNPFDAWRPPESVSCPGGISDIERQMEQWGDGSRAEVMVLWEGQHGSGHVFVAQQIDGRTHFIDPQTGEDGVGYYFDSCETDSIRICRTDNKEPSEWINDCCA